MEASKHRPTLRVIDVLTLLSETDAGFALHEISSQLKIPKGSLFPIVHTLLQEKMIRFDSITGKYLIGIRSYEIGNTYIGQVDAMEEVRRLAKSVVHMCSETCHFAVRDHKDVIYLLKEDSSEPIRMVSFIGKRLSAHCTAIGKALLADQEESYIREIFKEGLPQVTSKTITNLDDFCRQIAQVKKSGLAYETEESSMNVTCIAVPIYKNNAVIAAMSVSVPVFRADKEKMNNIEYILQKTKKELEELLEKIPFQIA